MSFRVGRYRPIMFQNDILLVFLTLLCNGAYTELMWNMCIDGMLEKSQVDSISLQAKFKSKPRANNPLCIQCITFLFKLKESLYRSKVLNEPPDSVRKIVLHTCSNLITLDLISWCYQSEFFSCPTIIIWDSGDQDSFIGKLVQNNVTHLLTVHLIRHLPYQNIKIWDSLVVPVDRDAFIGKMVQNNVTHL